MKYFVLILLCVALSAGITIGLLSNQQFLLNTSPKPSSSPTNSEIKPISDRNIQRLEKKIEQLEASYAALLEKQTSDEQVQKPSTTVVKYPNQTAPAFTNQVIYLGSATTTNRTWTQTGVEVSLHSADYPAGTTAKFEAGLKIIGGEAWARLVNKTTGAIIATTEVSHNTNTTTWKSSPAFILHPGNNTYVVEILSSSSEMAILDGSRIILQK